MNSIELRFKLREAMLTVCDNVAELFIYPEELTSLQNDFPYITFLLGKATTEGKSRRFKQEVSIIGIVTGPDELLLDRRDTLKAKMIEALYKPDFQCVVTEVDNGNLFKPFGLDAGLFPPYAGVRIEVVIPEIIELIV